MKMGDSGFRLAYNIQFATDTKSKVVLGVEAVHGLDPGTLLPMMMQVHHRLDQLNLSPPPNWIADSGYSGKLDIEASSSVYPNCRVFAPQKTNKKVDHTKVRKYDSEAVKEWRKRIASEEMKELYSSRCSTAEFVNAQVKNHGMKEFLVRGINKVRGMSILHAIAYNLQRYWDLSIREGSAI